MTEGQKRKSAQRYISTALLLKLLQWRRMASTRNIPPPNDIFLKMPVSRKIGTAFLKKQPGCKQMINSHRKPLMYHDNFSPFPTAKIEFPCLSQEGFGKL